MDRKAYFLEELNGIHEVPTLPQVAFKLIALISEDKASMREIGTLIEDDPPMVAKLLKIVNSSFYNLRNEIKSIKQAVVMLGMTEIKNLVFAMSVFSTFYHIKENEHFDFLKFWKHSAATGKVATVLSGYLDLDLSNTAFMGGLLHDFGRLVLQLYFREDYQKVFEYSIEKNVNLYTAEREAMGFSHDEAGYWLAQKWNLPEDLAKILKDHHQITPEQIDNDPLTAVIHVANRITNIWGIGIEPVPVMELIEENPVWLKMLELYPKLKDFPLDEMTRVFDMHLEEAEMFVEQISAYQEITAEDSTK